MDGFRLSLLAEKLDTPLEDILDSPLVNILLKSEDKALIKYFEFHIKEVLDIALSGEKSLLSVKCYQALLVGVKCHVLSLLNDEYFRDKCLDILSQKDIPPPLLGRLVGITSCFINVVPDSIGKNCGFLYQLLKYCDNSSVFNFFLTICSECERIVPFQQWLIDFGLCDYVLREIRSIDVNYQSECLNIYTDPVFLKLLCLYNIILNSSKNTVLKDTYVTKEVTEVSIIQFKNAPIYIINAQWEVINSLICQKTAIHLLCMINPAIDNIKDNYDKLSSFRVSSIEFLTKMMKLSSLTFDLLIQSSIIQILCEKIVKFPNSSILHGAFRDFVVVGLTRDDFALKMAAIYIPFFLDNTSDRILAATIFKCINLFKEAAAKNQKLNEILQSNQEYVSFVNTKLVEYNEVSDKPYGGPYISLSMIIEKVFS